MTVSMPAHVSTNASAVSLAPLAGLRSPNSEKTIPFKNVLDAFETPDEDNVLDSGEQKTNPQGTTSKKALPDATPEAFRAPQQSTAQYIAPPQSAPEIPFPNQRPAKLAVELAPPTDETAEAQPDAPAPEESTTRESTPSVIVRPPSEATQQDHARLEPTGSTQQPVVKSSTLPISVSTKAPTRMQFALREPSEQAPSKATVEKSQEPAQLPRASALPVQGPISAKSPAPRVQVPAPPEKAGSMNKPVRAVAPVTSSEDKTQAVRTPATIVPSQPKSTPLASPKAPAAPLPQARDANPTVGTKSQIAAAVAPPAMELHATPNAPPRSIAIAPSAAAPAPAQIQPTRKTSPEPGPVERHPATVQSEKTATARQGAAATIPAAPAPATSAITEPAAAPVAQAPIAPKPKETDSRRGVSTSAAPSNPAQAPDQSDAPKQTAQNIVRSVPEPVTTAAPPPQENTVAAPDIPEPPVTAKGKTGEIVVAPAPATRIATTSETFSFAARVIAPDINTVHALPTSTKSPLTPAEPQVTPLKAPLLQPKQAAPESQQRQSEPSSNSSDSKRGTQSTTQAEKPDTRAPKSTEVAQPEQTTGPVTRWSEVSAPQPTEAVYGRTAPELAEASHTGSTLAAQETHLVTQELPKSSTSSEILLHLTGNDQSGAAIRVADRAGSVSVSVHASDPVLRESLRSNLGELSNQLGQQGWKAEMLKPAALAAQSDSQQDSHSSGQQSSQQQQHSSGGERQSQRERRTPGGIWQQELEQQISSGDAHVGGNV